MSDRRKPGNGNGNGHYRGEGLSADPTENVKELVALHAERQDDLRRELARRLDQRDRMREIHRLEIAGKDKELQTAMFDNIRSEAQTEKVRVDATFAEQRNATALAETSRRSEQQAIAKEVSTTATTLATQTAANLSRQGLSTPLLVAIALALGGVILYAIEHIVPGIPAVAPIIK